MKYSYLKWFEIMFSNELQVNSMRNHIKICSLKKHPKNSS